MITEPIFLDYIDPYKEVVDELEEQRQDFVHQTLKHWTKLIYNSSYGQMKKPLQPISPTPWTNMPLIPKKQITYGDFDITDLTKDQRTKVRRIFSKIGEKEPQNLTLYFYEESIPFIDKIITNLNKSRDKLNLVQIHDETCDKWFFKSSLTQFYSFKDIRNLSKSKNKWKWEKITSVSDKCGEILLAFDHSHQQKFLTLITSKNDYATTRIIDALQIHGISTLTIVLK